MGLIKLEKGQILHKAGSDIVETLEVLVKGSLKISSSYSSITLNVGSLVGIVETPGKPYDYTIEAIEESAVYSYPYTSKDDIAKVVKSSPKIAPVLAAASAESAASVCAVYETEFDEAVKEYDQLMADIADYPALCIKVGEAQRQFPELEDIIPPERSTKIPEWTFEFAAALKANEATLKKNFYPLSVDISAGIVMSTYNISDIISTEVQGLTGYRRVLRKRTSVFNSHMKMIRAKLSDMERAESGESDGTVTIVNALQTILAYAGVPGETIAIFEDQISAFKANENRYDSSDEARALRRSIGSLFYKIYTPAFLRSLTDENIPMEVKMFFMFGFIDEELAGEKNTSILYNMVKAYTPDPDGTVLTLYEWLKKIYFLEVEPSKNEFDQDWPTYLREQKNSGAINDVQLEAMTRSPKHRLDFEIQNLFTLGNRMTFGRVSSFVPVFDQQNVLRPLDMAYITAAKVKEYFEKIRSIDYGVFCRQAVFSNTEIGITQLFYADDISPYMILMPNVGSRASLWQEIEG